MSAVKAEVEADVAAVQAAAEAVATAKRERYASEAKVVEMTAMVEARERQPQLEARDP